MGRIWVWNSIFKSLYLPVMDFLFLDFLLIKFKLLLVRSSNVSEHSKVTQNKNSFFSTWWRAADTGSGLRFCLKKEVCSPTTTKYSKNLCYVLLNRVKLDICIFLRMVTKPLLILKLKQTLVMSHWNFVVSLICLLFFFLIGIDF